MDQHLKVEKPTRRRFSNGFKALLSLLGADARQIKHSTPISPAQRAKQTPTEAPIPEASLSLMDVMSALPPAQIPSWFKQFFEYEPLFRLEHFLERSVAQRSQLIALLEKAHEAHLCRTRQTSELIDPENLRRFIEQAQRLQNTLK